MVSLSPHTHTHSDTHAHACQHTHIYTQTHTHTFTHCSAADRSHPLKYCWNETLSAQTKTHFKKVGIIIVGMYSIFSPSFRLCHVDVKLFCSFYRSCVLTLDAGLCHSRGNPEKSVINRCLCSPTSFSGNCCHMVSVTCNLFQRSAGNSATETLPDQLFTWR